MPISPAPDPNSRGVSYNMPGVSYLGQVEFFITVSPFPASEQAADQAVQSLLDHLQTWPDLAPGDPLSSSKVVSERYPVTVTQGPPGDQGRPATAGPKK